MKVKLEWYEIAVAVIVAVMRRVASLSKGFKDKYGLDPTSKTKGWEIDIAGALGEQAFAKGMNWYWNCGVNTHKKPDVYYVHVRTTDKDNNRLMIRQHEQAVPNQFYALVSGVAPEYEIKGWFRTQDCTERMKSNPDARGPLYFVPNDELYPIETLKDELTKFLKDVV